jgi:hypothetical protein
MSRKKENKLKNKIYKSSLRREGGYKEFKKLNPPALEKRSPPPPENDHFVYFI